MSDIKSRMLVCFSKRGKMRFTGHLDLLRVFQQAIRRAELPIAYSNGFNPHPLMSFALPLPLGMESVNDYMEITFKSPVETEAVIARLNVVLPDGLALSRVRFMAEGEKSPAALVTEADYRFNDDFPEAGVAAVSALLAEESLIAAKKTKNGVKNTDIRPDILGFFKQADGFTLRLSAGSERFLRPDLVVRLALSKAGYDPDAQFLRFIRLELLKGREGQSLYEMPDGL